MARELRRHSTRSQKGVSIKFIFALIFFLSGYLSASLFDWTSLSNWINRELLAKHPVVTSTKLTQETALPKPKFEFYTMLANDQAKSEVPSQPSQSQVASIPATPVPASNHPIDISLTKPLPSAQPLVKETAKPPVASDNNKAYLVQVAAFKSQQEAERVRASLSLKGFVVTISSVRQQQLVWYRVSIGPYSSLSEAQKAQASLARSEHIVGMVRKMSV